MICKVKFESIKYMIDIKENGSINIHKIIDMLLELSLPSEIYVSKSKQLAFNEQSAADDWRKRSIPTHLERHNPPTIIAKMGLKRA